MAQFRTRIEELEAQLARVRMLLLLAMREWHTSAAAAAHACSASRLQTNLGVPLHSSLHSEQGLCRWDTASCKSWAGSTWSCSRGHAQLMLPTIAKHTAQQPCFQ